MSPQDFILQNVKKELLKLGYEENVALSGADMALDHYRRCSQASRKGRIFDDCLFIAKAWAQKLQAKKT
ncbi:hypothetical protein [Enterobacter ludwigii]|uniref:hypothetical protein n=1 Tax=Enterobacter TaxID=547 RepID=UPI000642AD95|nr:hypothetical protein [Enterobacter ludwigii]KLP39262.1 hypothetical protein ABR36_11250 [Enterobacter ludwigii]